MVAAATRKDGKDNGADKSEFNDRDGGSAAIPDFSLQIEFEPDSQLRGSEQPLRRHDEQQPDDEWNAELDDGRRNDGRKHYA